MSISSLFSSKKLEEATQSDIISDVNPPMWDNLLEERSLGGLVEDQFPRRYESRRRRQASTWQRDGTSLRFMLTGGNKGRPDSYAVIRGSKRLSSVLKFTSNVGRYWSVKRDGGKVASEYETKKRAEGCTS